MNFSLEFLYGYLEGWSRLDEVGYDKKIHERIINCLRICIIFMSSNICRTDIFIYKKRTSDNKNLFSYCIRFLDHKGLDKRVLFYQTDLKKKYFDAYICKKIYEEFGGRVLSELDCEINEIDEVIMSFKNLEI